MNLSALPELLISWIKGQGASMILAGRGQEQAASPFKPGQQYDGQVLENLANGRSLVKVGKETLDMALPGKQARPGDTVRLTFLNAGPRPTFLLNQTAAGSAPQPVRLSEAAHQVSALIRYAQSPVTAPTAAGTAAQTPQTQAPVADLPRAPGPTLATAPAPAASQTPAAGRTPAAAQTTSAAQPAPTGPSAQGGPAAAARPIVVNTGLLLNTAANPTSLSAAVASRTAIPAMAMSGQAVDGLRAALAPSTTLTTQGVTQAALAQGHVLPLRLRQVVKESGLFYESHLSRWVKGEMSQEAVMREPQARLARTEHTPTGVAELRGMPEEAARLAGRQLMMLEGGPFVWQGQAWPGQTMEWLVEERPGGGGGGEEEAPQWHTELRLTLPRLGRLAADLKLSAQGLQIRIGAVSEETLGEIRAALPELADRLREVNLNVTGLAAQLTPQEIQ